MFGKNLYGFTFLLMMACALLGVRLAAQTGGAFEIEKSVIAPGGGQTSGGGFELTGTIGQPLAGTESAGGQFALISGFWGGGAAPTSLTRAPFDFDGDGRTDVSIFRSAPAEWWYRRSSDNLVFAAQFGAPTGIITPSDFTGDGKTDIAFFRPASGQWFVLRSEDSTFYAFPFGAAGDVPAPADFDGDNRTDAAVFRPSSATWFIQASTSGVIIQQFGLSIDRPVPNAFVR